MWCGFETNCAMLSRVARPSFSGSSREFRSNLWTLKFFSQVGEACGGILQIDRKTECFQYLHEAKIKVRVSEGDGAVFVTISPISPAIRLLSKVTTSADGRKSLTTAKEAVSINLQNEWRSRFIGVEDFFVRHQGWKSGPYLCCLL